MFDGKYLDWNKKKIKTIIDYYGHPFFVGKTILDLGCGHGDIGAALYRLGGDVTCVDARNDHLKIAQKKYPGIKTQNIDLDLSWPFKNYNLILDLGILCHLKDYENHLKKVCASTQYLVIETAVIDVDDPNFYITNFENQSTYDCSFNGFGCIPSAKSIERILNDCGMSFKRMDLKKINSGPYIYDWTATNSKNYNNTRRLWFAKKKNLEEKNIIVEEKANIISTSIVLASPRPIPITIQGQFISSKEIINPSVPKTKIEFPYIPKNSPDNVKTALCLSGYLRTFELNYESLYWNILNKTNCDVFIHTWDTIGNNIRHADLNVAKISTNMFISRIISMYSPLGLTVEPAKNFEITPLMQKQTEGRDIKGVISMFYKIKACNDLKSKYEKEKNFTYDCVIRCRPDLNFDSPIEINKETDLNNLYLPQAGDYTGYNDQFAFSNSKNMDIYSSLYDYFVKYLEMGMTINPEKLLKFHIGKNALPVKRTPIKYFIRRPDGGQQRNEDLERWLGFVK